jgi:hypothetical protein
VYFGGTCSAQKAYSPFFTLFSSFFSCQDLHTLKSNSFVVNTSCRPYGLPNLFHSTHCVILSLKISGLSRNKIIFITSEEEIQEISEKKKKNLPAVCRKPLL